MPIIEFVFYIYLTLILIESILQAMSTDTQYYVVSMLLVFLSTFLINFVYYKLNKTRPKLPPSPPTIPVIGHLHLLWPSFHKSLQNLSTQYGQIFSLRLGFTRCIVVSSASVATEVFKTHDLAFAEDRKSVV